MSGSPLSEGSRPKLAAKARLKWDRHESVHMLLYPERGLVLNETATAIVKLCDGRKTIAEIAHELAKAADGAPESVLADVVDFVENLRTRALLESY